MLPSGGTASASDCGQGSGCPCKDLQARLTRAAVRTLTLCGFCLGVKQPGKIKTAKARRKGSPGRPFIVDPVGHQCHLKRQVLNYALSSDVCMIM